MDSSGRAWTRRSPSCRAAWARPRHTSASPGPTGVTRTSVAHSAGTRATDEPYQEYIERFESDPTLWYPAP